MRTSISNSVGMCGVIHTQHISSVNIHESMQTTFSAGDARTSHIRIAIVSWPCCPLCISIPVHVAAFSVA